MEKFQALHVDFGPLVFLKLGSINQRTLITSNLIINR